MITYSYIRSNKKVRRRTSCFFQLNTRRKKVAKENITPIQYQLFEEEENETHYTTGNH